MKKFLVDWSVTVLQQEVIDASTAERAVNKVHRRKFLVLDENGDDLEEDVTAEVSSIREVKKVKS